MVLFATELEFKEEPGQGQFLKLAKKGHNVKFDNDERNSNWSVCYSVSSHWLNATLQSDYELITLICPEIVNTFNV